MAWQKGLRQLVWAAHAWADPGADGGLVLQRDQCTEDRWLKMHARFWGKCWPCPCHDVNCAGSEILSSSLQ